MSYEGRSEEVDLEKYPNAKALVERCKDFFAETDDLTPGRDLEAYLNENYGPGNPIYEDLCKYCKIGLEEGWCANIEMDGPKYRRSKIKLPSAETRFFSLTTVYMESQEEYSGQYHKHPYGEINCVVQIDKTAELKGMQGWQSAGWTSPGAGTHHYPQVMFVVAIEKASLTGIGPERSSGGLVLLARR
ncbi:hypothetical protein LTR70_006271 [Exophiala xenobiotica]|uniref:p-hydroxylaminobenzoate lyase n=1 Tax=Lithohypha guttulata TaxID=1690604 RepID=A0ABR0KHW8_9EURO|nr:hypothetical protein LTR24_002413 [Lithohypha guttulata]KAK5316317.1 hypothetical protein LTR70_006271 [Exophiala xenobiotica]